MATYPFARQPKLNRKQIMALYETMDFIPNVQNIIWLGRTGCGKTGLATSFLTRAIQQGHTGLFVSFAQLITELFRSLADHSEARALKPYLTCDVLYIDELGYIETEAAQVGLFFSLMQRRHKKKPTLITSNLGFSEWGTFLKNDHLTVALLDRLTECSHVINMKDCVSLREKLSPES
jgi:DNA replication protein DnaC